MGYNHIQVNKTLYLFQIERIASDGDTYFEEATLKSSMFPTLQAFIEKGGFDIDGILNFWKTDLEEGKSERVSADDTFKALWNLYGHDEWEELGDWQGVLEHMGFDEPGWDEGRDW